MVMENRPVDPGSIQGSHRPISFIRMKHRTRANDILCKTEYWQSYCKFSSQKPYYTNVYDVPRSLQSWVSTIQTVVLTADVFQLFIKYLEVFLVFFCAPRCHLTDGCHLTHTGAIVQLNDFIQGFARHPRCHLSDGCDAELINTTHGLTRQRCCRQ